jgi:hypothetical protein
MPWTLKIRVTSVGPGSMQSKGIAALGGLDQRRAATGCGQAVLLSPPLKIGSEHHMSEQWGQATAEPSRCDCWLAGQATASRRTIAGLSISANRTPRHAARGGCVPPAPLGTAVSSRREWPPERDQLLYGRFRYRLHVHGSSMEIGPSQVVEAIDRDNLVRILGS